MEINMFKKLISKLTNCHQVEDIPSIIGEFTILQ